MSSPLPSGDLHDLLADAPTGDYSLLELELDWDGLDAADEQLAAALRLFVVTWDPLDWLADRGVIWATANADGDTLELPAYLLLAEVRRRLDDCDGDLNACFSPLAATVLGNALDSRGTILAGAQPTLAFRGDARALNFPRRDGAPDLRLLDVRAPLGRWEPLGLGAIQDLVQEAYGPVDFDRSQVALNQIGAPRPGCPACAGRRFGFPGDLAESAEVMCPSHRAAADEITRLRIERAQRSNGAGWRAIAKASARINGLPESDIAPIPERHTAGTPRRNDPCPCGSGRKYKNCHGR
jgi:hypothetical protein